MKYTRIGMTAAVGLGLGLTALAATLPAAATSDAHRDGVAANSAFGIQDNVLAAGLEQSPVAWGQLPLANPNGGISHYGYNTSNGGPLTQDPKEAFKTEPDKNVYLTFGEKHYLFQGHEGGPQGYVTRVDGDIVPLPALGSGGYEGIQNDSAGNVWLVEDIGGAKTDGGKAPNSYVYRFTPTTPGDLSTGTLQALQVSRADGTAVTAKQLADNPSDQFVTDLHTYGTSFTTTWVTVTPGADNGATAAAAAAEATPFKRPENGVFRPGTDFGEFYFTETGDTNKESTLPGAYGGVFRLSQSSPSADTGTLSPVFIGDLEHTGLDNIQFASKDKLLVVEDAGDSLHAQRDALDSGYMLDLSKKNKKAPEAVRWLAEGRDASATYDHTTSPGYNDGDNEITGIHVSNGDPTAAGILGAQIPQMMTGDWRTFWTQQHGDNVTWELHSAASADSHGSGRHDGKHDRD